MKRLYLLRHAKAKPAEGGGSDFDRGLAPRGRRNCPVMAAHMRAKGYLPGLILCSSARRTRETLDLLQAGLGSDAEIIFDRQLYLAGSLELLRLIQQQNDGLAAIAVVGHNPGLHQFAVGLAGKGDPTALRRMREKFPTLALAVLEHDGDSWRNLDWDKATLLDLAIPADLE